MNIHREVLQVVATYVFKSASFMSGPNVLLVSMFANEFEYGFDSLSPLTSTLNENFYDWPGH